MYKAMIVDDYDVYRNDIKALKVWGEKIGFVITAEASSGREALKKLRSEAVDILITDIRMPVIDGIELTKKVFEEKLSKCVVLMSQFSDFEYARKGIHCGAFEYLIKPVEEIDLLATLKRAAVYIRTREEELSKIDYMDNVLTDQLSDQYSPDDFKTLMKRISEGSPESTAVAAKMLEVIWSDVHFDVLKSAYIINKVLKDLLEMVNKDYPWMNKLSATVSGVTMDFSAYGKFSDIKASFIEIVEKIMTLISKYELGLDNSKIVRTACRYVLENLDAPISLQILSKKLFISGSYLSLLFKEKTGINLIDYITVVKMERAKILLADSNLKNYEIAEKLGFSDEYFSKLFKKTFNMTPSKFRNNISLNSL